MASNYYEMNTKEVSRLSNEIRNLAGEIETIQVSSYGGTKGAVKDEIDTLVKDFNKINISLQTLMTNLADYLDALVNEVETNDVTSSQSIE